MFDKFLSRIYFIWIQNLFFFTTNLPEQNKKRKPLQVSPSFRKVRFLWHWIDVADLRVAFMKFSYFIKFDKRFCSETKSKETFRCWNKWEANRLGYKMLQNFRCCSLCGFSMVRWRKKGNIYNLIQIKLSKSLLLYQNYTFQESLTNVESSISLFSSKVQI